MNEELWASVERKLRGYVQATMNLPLNCDTCGEFLEPQDTGLDPLTGKRNWVVKCCGGVDIYEEKVNTEELLADEYGLAGEEL
jgi:hypothetical protein